MNRLLRIAIRMMLAVIFLCAGLGSARAQEPPKQDQAKPDAAKQEPSKKEDEEEENPFAPQPAPVLPPGMTGSDVNDPRYKLTPGPLRRGRSRDGHQASFAGEEAGRVSAGRERPR